MEGSESAAQQMGGESAEEPRTQGVPPSKRLKSSLPPTGDLETRSQPKTPDIASETGLSSHLVDHPVDIHSNDVDTTAKQHSTAPVDRELSYSSLSSDLSGLSNCERAETQSPSFLYSSSSFTVPPAPPSTPASQTSVFPWNTATTPLPIHAAVLNASQLERQMMAEEGPVTPAPKLSSRANATSTTGQQKSSSNSSGSGADKRRPNNVSMSEDFSDWAVGDRYKMIRILGRGSYGEVAQAVDLFVEEPKTAHVAIKRIQSPFEQEVDAIRLYREIHILRRMRGHDCIIQLLNVVQPPTDDLDDFHDLYLVFECTCCSFLVTLSYGGWNTRVGLRFHYL
jgi:hypothetical protein